MTENILRDRTEEFMVLRRAAAQQRRWMEGKSGAETPPPEPQPAGPSTTRPPSWVTVVTHFTELETAVSTRLERLYVAQKEVIAPRFNSSSMGETEEELQEQVDNISADVKKFINELQRLLSTGIRVSDESNPDEQRAADNVKRHLSTRLSSHIQAFRQAQEQFADQLKKREEKKKKFRIGSADVHERLERESRVAKFLEQGYSQVEINELLLMEEQANETNRELQNILASVTELNQMFQDLHALVVEQGSLLDRIDFNIEQTAQKVSKGVEELKKARAEQKKCVVA